MKILHFGIIGTGIGFIMTTVSILSLRVGSLTVKEMGAWVIASFLMGVISLIMFTDKLSLPLATAIHFVLIFITVASTCAACGYGNGIGDLLIKMLPSFLITYVVIYLIVFAVSKANEREINRALSEKQK